MIGIDFLEADTALFGGHLGIEIGHELNELAERELAIVITIVEIEVGARTDAFFRAGLEVVASGAIFVGHGLQPRLQPPAAMVGP